MQQVRIYRNLHKGCYSVQAKVNGRWKVVAHTTEIILSDVTFKVSQAGRQRVLRERAKNVHAFVIGTVGSKGIPMTERVSYNPYKSDSFYSVSSNQPVHQAQQCYLMENGVIYAAP